MYSSKYKIAPKYTFKTISDARVHVQVYTMGLRILKQLNFIDTYKGKKLHIKWKTQGELCR